MRKKEGKDWGYVILPVIYDNTTNEIDNDNFNEILDVVRGLAANDERIVEYFKDKGEINTKAKKEVEEQFNFEVLSEYMDEGELSKQLQIKVWEKLSKFQWMEFEEALKYSCNLKLKSSKTWREKHKSGDMPKNMPSSPHRVYENIGWTTWGDWLGTGRIADNLKVFLPYLEAKVFVSKLNLSGQEDWTKYSQSGNRPNNIPGNPQKVYKGNGWVNFGDWLGTGYTPPRLREFKPFNDAKSFVAELGLRNQNEWRAYVRSGEKPGDIPSLPNKVYKNEGWVSLGDWLGTKRVANQSKVWLSYEEAKSFAHKLNLKRVLDWKALCKSGDIPFNIPRGPQTIYKNKGWKGWKDFLGNE